MKRRISLLAFCLMALSAPLATLADSHGRKPARAIVGTASTIATVQDIDYETRIVTLRDSEGNLTTFTAGESMVNLPQVKKGDVVLMDYFQGFAIAVGPKGTGLTAREDVVEVEGFKPGERPKGTVTEITDVLAVVESVDKKNRIVTLEGPEATVVLKVADDVNLANVNAGDEVVARYVSLFAINVEPAPKVSGTVEIESQGIAVGVGVQWGHGTMKMYDGSVHKFKVGGLSLVDLGVSKASLSGEVYRLMDPKDFAGTYATGAAGATLGKGAAAVALQNRNGVVMHLKAKSKGARLSLAAAGLNVELVD
jgi:Cu/Ag efflux protein CusF